MAGLCVKWFTDNRNVARIIDIGSPKSPLQEEARRIFNICVLHGISIEPEWVPRASNEQTDYLSRIVDPDDWSVSLPIFQLLNSRWGPHTVDRFADERNCLLPRFDSRFWNPLCEAMDTFTRSWEFENNWLCPTPHLFSRALRHMRSCCAKGTLVTPAIRSILASSYFRRFTFCIFCGGLDGSSSEVDVPPWSSQSWCFWQGRSSLQSFSSTH